MLQTNPNPTHDAHIYSRLSAPTTTRLETALSSIMNAHCLTYSSGLSAFHALLIHLNPRRIAIGAGYHGCHGVISIVSKLSGLQKVDLHDLAAWDAAGITKGDVVHVETPLNPTGEASNLAWFAEEAHKRGAILTVDATFAPPSLLDPFRWGADAVMHSGTKYLGGHSDMLCGVLAVQREDWWKALYNERICLGSVMGSFEGWLGLRSLRTMELRVSRQSASAGALVEWLDSAADESVKKAVHKIQHASLQKADMGWLKQQMPNGFGPVFAIWMANEDMARRLPSKLRLFHHATSLGGVESLIEWRRMSDEHVDPRVLRVSVGIEDWRDLKEDLLNGFNELLKEGQKNGTEQKDEDRKLGGPMHKQIYTN